MDPVTSDPNRDPSSESGPSDGQLVEQTIAGNRKAFDQLVRRYQRQAIILFTIDQMPQKEVAETLNCSVEAVKWHVFQGRKKLRELLKDVI